MLSVKETTSKVQAIKTFFNKLHEKPRWVDVWILSLFTVIITLQPYFLHGEINLFEVGLYLPGINAIFHGLVPFRDFFHLRGPLELYLPAFLMFIFGKHIGILYLYFYMGTILTLIVCIFIIKELYSTRYFLYLMVPVLIARTFPRIMFTYWGGMRYAFGLLALLCTVRFFKRKKFAWLGWAGAFTALGFFTSAEIGVCAIFGVFIAFVCAKAYNSQKQFSFRKLTFYYVSGLALIIIPYGLYLSMTHSLIPYLQSVYAVVANMQIVINPHIVSVYPQNFTEAFLAMVNPSSVNFRHMTPSYFYIILLIYIVQQIRAKHLIDVDLGVIALGVYGMIIYNAAFRSIWAAQFEMALQPEKILFFYILEKCYLVLKDKKKSLLSYLGQNYPLKKKNLENHSKAKLAFIIFLFIGLFMSSIGYSIARFNHRFFTFRFLQYRLVQKDVDDLKPLARVNSRSLTIERARGILVPVDQADELEMVGRFISKNTQKDEVIFMYPELATYSFLFDRPFLGRFPIATFSWFLSGWHEELLSDFKRIKPRFVIVPQKMPLNWEEVYLALEINRKRYQEIMTAIYAGYTLYQKTPHSYIYKLKAS